MAKRSNVWIFMLIAYGFTWAFWVPEALIAQNIWMAPEGVQEFLAGPLNVGPWGPLVAAFVMTFIYQGRAGAAELLKRGFKVRVGKWWWALLLPIPLLIGGSLLLAIALGEPIPDFPALAEPIALPISLVVIFFFNGPLQEEFGWRGYVFEDLRHRYSALRASIVAALMWGFWHLPLFFIPRQEYYYNRPIWGLILTTLLVGIIIAWVYANTNGSVFAAMVVHTMFNWSNWVFPTLGIDSAALILFGAYFAFVIFILVRYGTKTFVRETEPKAGST